MDPESAAGLAAESERLFALRPELPRLGRLLRSLRRGAGESLLIVGPAGAGRSSILRFWGEEARREGGVLPLSIAVPSAGATLAGFAEGLVASLAAQCLVHRAGAAGDTPPLERLGAVWPEAALALAQVGARLRSLPSGSSPSFEVSLAPELIARRTGVPVLCLVDDLHHLLTLSPAGLACWSPAAALSHRAPCVFTSRAGAALEPLLGPSTPSLRRVDLGPLAEGPFDQLLRRRALAEGADLGEEARQTVFSLTGGWPQYLPALLRAASAHPAPGALAVARAYGASVAAGEIAAEWAARLALALPSRPIRGVALEVLSYCLREDLEPPDTGRLSALMFRGEAEVEEALAGLERAGVARVDCRRVRVVPDPVLRDVVRALHRREFGGAASAAVAAAGAAEAVRALAGAAARRRSGAFRGALRAVFEAWDGRSVPAVLFDAPAFAARFEAGEGPSVAEALAGEEDCIRLPRVAAAASGRIGVSTSPAGLEMDAVAWGWRAEPGDPSGEVAWAARYVPGGAGAAAALRELDRDVAALQAAGDLPGERVVRWAVLGAALDAEGAAAAAELRIATSTLPGLRALAGLLGLAIRIPDPGRAAPRADLEIEMTLPAAADAELVAARALEQIAEMAALPADEVGRVRTALIEACINAFEHSGVAGARVRVVFALAGSELRIRVENRGRPLAAVPISAGAERRRRGWGLRLMRGLMDSVELEPREDGVTLLMTKRIDRGTEG